MNHNSSIHMHHHPTFSPNEQISTSKTSKYSPTILPSNRENPLTKSKPVIFSLLCASGSRCMSRGMSRSTSCRSRLCPCRGSRSSSSNRHPRPPRNNRFLRYLRTISHRSRRRRGSLNRNLLRGTLSRFRTDFPPSSPGPSNRRPSTPNFILILTPQNFLKIPWRIPHKLL